MTAQDVPAALRDAVASLTPYARSALRRSLLRALGRRAPPPAPLAGDLVNTEVEILDVAADRDKLATAIERAVRDGEGAPVVRLDHGGGYALLTSAQHLWRLVDRVDELELALAALASACVRGLSSLAATEALLQEVDA
jgi:hypothetical protein